MNAEGVVGVAVPAFEGGDGKGGAGVEGGGEAGEVIRTPAVVGIEEGDGLAGGEFEEAVAGGGDAPVFAEVGVADGPGRGGGEGADAGLGGVAGAVLDHDQFPVAVGLGGDGGEGVADETVRAVGGDEHAEGHLRPSAKSSHSRLAASPAAKGTGGA